MSPLAWALLAELAAAMVICGWHDLRHHGGAAKVLAALRHRPAPPVPPHAHWLAHRTTAGQRWAARIFAVSADTALGFAWFAGLHLLVLAVTTASLAAVAVTYLIVPKGSHADDLLPDSPAHSHGL